MTEDDLIRTVSTAYSSGWRQVKLYFMCGLPTETDEDVVAIASLAHRVIAATGSPSTIRNIPYQEAYGSGYEDMQRRVPDCGLAWDLVGFRARRSLDEIIKSVISDQAAWTPAVAAATS